MAEPKKSAREIELEKQLEEMKQKLEAKPGRVMSLRVAKSGGISLYGLGRFPATFFKEQWEAIVEMAPEITAFIAAHESELKTKDKK